MECVNSTTTKIGHWVSRVTLKKFRVARTMLLFECVCVYAVYVVIYSLLVLLDGHGENSRRAKRG